MRVRLRKLFIVVSAFGYGFLGCGPSLWALDVQPADRILECLEMGCTCRLHPGQKGAQCCCLRNRALLRRFPDLIHDSDFWKALRLDPPRPAGTCQMEPTGCDLPMGHGMAPVPGQAHLPRSLDPPLAPAALGSTPLVPFSARSQDRLTPPSPPG